MSEQTSYAGNSESYGSESYLDGVFAPVLKRSRSKQGRLSSLAKRTFDIVLALGILMVLSPIVLFCVLALALAKGPVVFSQSRIGAAAKPFRVYKFRTMVPDAPQVLRKLLASDPDLKAEYERDHKLRNDPRITTLGRFLRRTSLDELPQLWNVLKGDMSLVGPRPVEMFELSKYGCHAHYYYAQKPGLTGIWQTSGRSGVTWEQRVAMDTFYSRRRSLWLDLKIVLATVKVVLLGRGAY